MVLFDQWDLAERSNSHPLKVFNEKFEYVNKKKGMSFMDISNYPLNATQINRTLVLSVPDLDQKLDDLIQKSSGNIVENISDKLKRELIFDIISKVYNEY